MRVPFQFVTANIGFSGDFGSVQFGTNEHFFETDLILDPLAADYNKLLTQFWLSSSVIQDSTSHVVMVSQFGGTVRS